MCGRISQHVAKLYLKDRANLEITHASAVLHNELIQTAIWEGHIRDDNNFTKVSMQRVIIPDVTEIEHHGYVIKGKFNLIGWTRLIDEKLRVWIETEDTNITGVKDRWPKFAKCQIVSLDKPLSPR